MSFVENLKRKIAIDRLAERASASLGPAGSGRKIDEEAMRELLDAAGYHSSRRRGLELYQKQPGAEKDWILVLDNELALYHTRAADVLLRKNPTLKEMVNLFNMKKILNDSDVAVSKGIDTLSAVHSEALAPLDLTYSESDIREIAESGKKALSGENAAGVEEALELFAALLNLSPPPVRLSTPAIRALGKTGEGAGGSPAFGPILLYDRSHHLLRFFDRKLGPEEMRNPRRYLDMAGGREEADLEGGDVMDALAGRVMQETPRLNGQPEL
jgi:hypothetical protein